MARKAGQIVTGATKVKAAIETGEVDRAADRHRRGRRRHARRLLGSLKGFTKSAAGGRGSGLEDVPHFELLDSEPIGFGTRA